MSSELEAKAIALGSVALLILGVVLIFVLVWRVAAILWRAVIRRSLRPRAKSEGALN